MNTHLPTLAPGTVVAGRYRVEGMIGEGGFGAVFRATQLNLGRTVALKVLQPDLVAHEESIARFRREAQLAQKLEHPNTVRLFDFGRAEDGLPFIAWELLKGQPLDELIKRGGMPAQRVARIASQVLKSLMEAHSLGVIHRDIKPANIFICDFPGEPDFVKVLDFGIAKALVPEAGSTMAGGLTQLGHAVGTPNYMAPEQVSGGAVGPSSDLYALGLVMAEALTGQVVFTGETAIEICMAQLSQAPVPHAPQVLQSPLGSVIHRATQKAPERRYASAGDMLRDLEAVGSAGLAGSSSPGRSSGAGSAPAANPMAFAQTNVFAPGASYPGAGASYPGAGASYPGAGASYPGPGGGASYPGPRASFPGPAHGGAGAYAHGSTPGSMGPSHPSAGAYGPPPYGGYMAPVGPAPMPYGPPPARAKGGSGCSIVLVVLLIGGALAAIAGIVLIVVLSADTLSSPGGGGSGKPAGGSVQGRRFRDLSTEDLAARIESAGYSTTTKSSSEGQSFSTISYTVTRSGVSGAVQLLKYADTQTAGFAEDALRQNNTGAVVRDENALLIVMIFPQDSGAQQQLLDAITR